MRMCGRMLMLAFAVAGVELASLVVIGCSPEHVTTWRGHAAPT